MASDAKRELSRIFDDAAEDYDKDIGLFGRFGTRLVEVAGIAGGERVLDLACGAGAVLVPAAAATGPAGSAIGVDLAPAMVARTNAALQRHDLASHAEAHAMDMESLAFADASFDVALSGFGVFFASDPSRLLSEIHRVLAPGGRFAFSIFDGPLLWPWLLRVVADYSPTTPIARSPMWRTTSAVEHVLAAGFAAPTNHVVVERFVVADVDAVWRQLWTLGTRRLIEAMDAETREALRGELATQLERHRTDGGYEAVQSVTIVVAPVP